MSRLAGPPLPPTGVSHATHRAASTGALTSSKGVWVAGGLCVQTVDIKKSFGRAKDHMIQRSRARIQEQRIQQVCARGLAPYATDVPPFQLVE